MTETSQPKHIAILGSTGSIGRQTLEVIEAHPDEFVAEVLTAGSNADLLIEQARRYKPNAVVIADEKQYQKVKEALHHLPIKVFAGHDAVASSMEMESIDLVVTALVGYAGLQPTLRAIRAGKHIALANKETLVVAGDLITREIHHHKVHLIPVDSEHSAIFQCLSGEGLNRIDKIILTASGGPFRGKKRSDLAGVTREQALKHPNWSMGAKVTIDSASLMNKGLEVIEAKWLFGLEPDRIEVVVHPQSIVHSLVQFEDKSIKAQLGLPDMRLPIQYALTWPGRLKGHYEAFDFSRYPSLTFEKPDTETFRNLALAFRSLREGGNKPCALNAANEIAVEAFLKDQIGFLEMSDLVERCLDDCTLIKNPTLDDYVSTDTSVREMARNLIR